MWEQRRESEVRSSGAGLKHTRWQRLVLLVATSGLILAGCGGAGTDEVPIAAEDDQSRAVGSEPADVDPTSSGDDGGIVVVTSDRPDWLPAWLLLPEGLDIQATVMTPETGEAVLSGAVPDSDIDNLYSDAAFMVQSGGYSIIDEFQVGGRGFTAEHSTDGSTVRFVVAQVTDDLHQVGWEFTGLNGAGGVAASPSQPGSGQLDRRGTLTFTVTDPRTSVRFEGACDASAGEANFRSDDGLTDFSVATVEEVGGGGKITVDPEDEFRPWIPATDSETSTADTSSTGAYYEGDFVRESTRAFGIVQITCDE